MLQTKGTLDVSLIPPFPLTNNDDAQAEQCSDILFIQEAKGIG